MILTKITSSVTLCTLFKHTNPKIPRYPFTSTTINKPDRIRYSSFARQKKLTKEQRIKESKYFPHLLDNDPNFSPIGFRELQLRLFSASIREKPQWWEKMKVEHVRAHWTKELEEQELNGDFIEFFFKELERYREIEQGIEEELGFAINAHIDGVWRSNELVSESLKKELIEGLRTIEDVPEDKKDWHAGSGNQVLNLVHPSLYPLVYNKTKSLETGLPIPLPGVVQTWVEAEEDKWVDLYGENPNIWSTQFQWLPSDFQVSDDGKTKIKSYINNLHPVTHRNLYSTIEKIFSRFVPMFNLVLDDLRRKTHHMRRVKIDLLQRPQKNEDRWPATGTLVDWDFGWDMGKLAGEMFSPPQFSANINGKTVKVITKLTNIHLTPLDPKYPGGTWHVEGMNNERIIATGIYYYDCKNITDSVLSFRALLEDSGYEDYDAHSYRKICGIDTETDSPILQNVGEILTTQDRCIAFPNLYHQVVNPFGIVDPYSHGHRKILAFFLCEPNNDDIVSTSSVAPQQEHWLSESSPEELRKTGVFKELPEEKFQRVIQHMKNPMSRVGAEEHRIKLMDERSMFTRRSRLIHGARFNFWL